MISCSNARVLLAGICIFDPLPIILEPAWDQYSSMAIWHLGIDIRGPPQCMGAHPDIFDQGMFGSEMCTPGLQGGNIGVTPFISILRKLLTNMEMNMCSNCGQVSVLCIGFCSSYTVSCTVDYIVCCTVS